MKRTNVIAAAVSCALVAGCVPATEPLVPAGAAGFATDPSPASRGEPFTTADGWTLRFEQAVLQGLAIAIPVDPADLDVSSPSDTDVFRWNARDRVELYASALSVAPWRLSLKLHNGRSPLDTQDQDNVVDRGVDPSLARRFLQAADGDGKRYFDDVGPVMVVVVRGEKDGHVVRLDVALSPNGSAASGPGIEPVLDVRANALVTVPLPISAERLFLTSTADGQHLEFEAFARADADGDGDLTAAELERVIVPCPKCQFNGKPGTEPTGSLLALLRSRLATVIDGF